MRFILFLLLLLLTKVCSAQELKKDGTFIFDFSGKKKTSDSTTLKEKEKVKGEMEEGERDKEKVKSEKEKVGNSYQNATAIKKKKPYALFNGLFMAGINACQVDGDYGYGYYYVGAHLGVGTLIRFHPSLSASVEILYSMKGAQDRFIIPQGANVNRFKIIYDYVAIAPSLNYHFRQLFFIGISPVINFMVRHKELDHDGIDITKSPPTGQPHFVDFCLRGELTFLIKGIYGIGGGYEYSLIALRPSLPNSRSHGMFNNVINVRFSYLLRGKK